MRATRAALAIALATLAIGARAAAQHAAAPSPPPVAISSADEARARRHFEHGIALVNLQDFNGALAEFQASYAISHRPTLLYDIGLAYQTLHQYPEAARALAQYLRDAGDVPADRRARIESAVAEIREFIAEVVVHGLPNGTEVRIDGSSIGRAPFADAIPVGAGRHTMVFTADGYSGATEVITVAGGDRREITIAMTAVHDASASDATSTALRVDVSGAQQGVRVTIDDAAAEPSAWRAVTEGVRRVSVTAPGYQRYVARVHIAPGERRDLRIAMHPTRSGLSPIPFAVATAGVVVFGVGAAILGAVAQSDYDHFQTLARSDPTAAGLASRGNAEVAVTDVFIGIAGLAAVGAVVLLTQTRFSSGEHAVDIAVVPVGGGGVGVVGGRF